MYEPPIPGPGLPEPPTRSGDALGSWVIVALPLLLGAVMLVVTPSYFRPMLASALGWWLLALVVVLEAAALGAVSWGNRRFAGNRLRLKVFTMLVMVGLIFPTLWILLLGPAILVIVQSTGGG